MIHFFCFFCTGRKKLLSSLNRRTVGRVGALRHVRFTSISCVRFCDFHSSPLWLGNRSEKGPPETIAYADELVNPFIGRHRCDCATSRKHAQHTDGGDVHAEKSASLPSGRSRPRRAEKWRCVSKKFHINSYPPYDWK